jgi:hypothetical protein
LAVRKEELDDLVADWVASGSPRRRKQRARLPLNERGREENPVDVERQLLRGGRFHVGKIASDERREGHLFNGDPLPPDLVEQQIERAVE